VLQIRRARALTQPPRPPAATLDADAMLAAR
jgi:hypothetical protein